MADNLGLFAHWFVGLAVFVTLLHKNRRVIAPRARLCIEIMWWLFATLIDEIDCEIELLFLFG